MNWYHYVMVYLAGWPFMFSFLAHDEAMTIRETGEPYWNKDANRPFVLVFMFLWPIIGGFCGIYAFVAWAWTSLVVWFTPKRKAPAPEPEHTPGTNYRDGGSR